MSRSILVSLVLGLAVVVPAVALSATLGGTARALPAPAGLAAAAPSPDETPGRASRAYLHSYNLPAHGVALQGYSPVSYFEGRAERGSALFAVEHEGVTYHLANARQVETFRRDPDRHVPAFGGWCAFGMAVEDKFPVDPTRFEIVDGRLLLFLANEGIDALALWNAGDESALMERAQAHWRRVRG